MRIWASLAVVILFSSTALAAIPIGAQEPSPGIFPGCALRVSPDGGLYSSPIDFPVTPFSDERAAQNTAGRGPYCNIINGTNPLRAIPAGTLASLDENFTSPIWPNDTAAFGNPGYAKINIIITTQDGMGGVAGYFSPSDPDAIYLDYDDLALDLDVTAHEFQHLIHNSKDSWETEFVNEGCSETGVYVCYGSNRPGLGNHWSAYSSATDNDFTQWDTGSGVIGDYGGAGLFTIYCYDHYGNTTFTRNLVADGAKGIQSYNTQLSSKGETFETVFKKWFLANWINNWSIDNHQWGYRTCTNLVGYTFLEKTYPATCSSQVQQAWSADYVRFEPTTWNQNMGDLEVNITISSGNGYAGICKIGRGGTPDAVEIIPITAGKGTALVSNLGGSYSVACLGITGLGGSCSYTYSTRVVDRTPPVTTIGVTPASPNGKNGFYITKPTVGLYVNEQDSDIFYRWDSGSYLKFSSMMQAPEGNHTLQFYSRDLAGNTETTRSCNLRVDLTPPNTTCTVDPAIPDGRSGWYKAPATMTLQPETGANLSCAWDNSGFQEYTGPVAMPEGLHNFIWKAVDLAGNQELQKSLQVKRDSVLPLANCTFFPVIPDGLNGWYVKPPTVQLSSTDSGSPALFYKWDNGVENAYSGEFKAMDGHHSLTFFAIDSAGNRGPDSVADVMVDSTAPVITAATSPDEPDGNDNWFRTAPVVTLESNETGTLTLYYRWDTEQKQEYTEPLTVLEGVHQLFVYGVDEAGNKGRERLLQFKVDSIRPVTNLSISPEDLGSAWYHTRTSIALTTSEGNCTVQYQIDGGTLNKYTKAFDLNEGSHTLVFYATDGAGNIEQKQERKFKIDTKAPILISQISKVNITTQQDLVVTAQATDENGVSDFFFDWGDGLNSGWTPETNLSHRYASAGEYIVKIRVRDKSGLEAASNTQKVTVVVPTQTGGGGGDGPAGGLNSFLSSIPMFVWWILLILIVVAIAGAIAGKAYSRHRKKRLYAEVERAEAERERRHTMEVEEDHPAPRGEPAGSAFRAPEYATDFSSGGQAAYGEAYAEPAYAPIASEPEKAPEIQPEPEQTTVDFGNAKILEHKPPEEIPIETEIGAAAPIWATSAKTGEAPPQAKAPAPKPSVAEKPKTSPPVQSEGEKNINDLVKQLATKQPPAPAPPQVKPPSPKVVAAPKPVSPQPVPKPAGGDTEGLHDILRKLDTLSKK